MNLFSLRTPLVLVTVGALMIAASFLWNQLIPIDRMIDHSQLEGLTARSNERHGIGTRRPEPIAEDEHREPSASLSNDEREETGSGRAEAEREGGPEGGSVERDRNAIPPVASAGEKESVKYIRRVRFLQDTAPQLARWLGVILAAAGSILYPVVLLRRAAEEAEEEEASVTD